MKLSKAVLSALLGAYILVTLPVLVVFTKSDYSRFVALQSVAHWKESLIGVASVYVGDSITAGGRNWGDPFDVINLAGNGYTTRQIEDQVKAAQEFDADNLFILAGTNDILGKQTFDRGRFERDFSSLFDAALETQMTVFVTEIPYTADEKNAMDISDANSIIRRLARERSLPTIDLNPELAPEGILLPEYSLDGVHLSQAAYTIWQQRILNEKKRRSRSDPSP